jgi:exopolyphosphatase/guanosine-5'-triphosphate,3'-diphosphate pyrophosphatase
MEEAAARAPGFGDCLDDWIAPLYERRSAIDRRLVRAACLLHDVSWRAHPDYRAEICFDNATRANLGGLNHSERVFLGISLLHRYSNSREGTRFEELYSLIDDKTKLEAEVLGKAMRFGAMLWMEKGAERAAFKWFPKKRLLELHLTRDAMPLYGEIAEVRLQSLANSLDAELSVKIRKD